MYREIVLPESQISIYESKHTPGEEVRPHHHSVYQILYFLSGKGHILLEGKRYPVGTDQLVLIAPGSEHAVYADSQMTLLVLAFGTFLAGLPGAERLFAKSLEHSKYQVVDAMWAGELRESLRNLLYEQSRPDGYADLAMRSQLLHALLILARTWDVTYFPDSNAHRAYRLKHYIETHYFERLSAEDLAALVKVTPRHMNDVFKQYYFVTPLQYLTDIRVKRAKELLAETEKEVVSICFEVGFETLSTFYRAFKKKVGTSPQQFRKQSV
ncbi:MAG: AraC family transcriptional regulator [Alicyclobacillus sp.]|nr:AraC family transcriptional regulator [Alicyclobacillus sp.]